MFDINNLVALDINLHSGVKIAPVTDYSFAKDYHAVPVAGTEFSNVAKDYAIVFMQREDGSFIPTAMLGLRPSENLFIDEKGGWNARYIPFFVRRFPFVAAETEGDNAIVCIDKTAMEKLSSPTGMALFENGEPSADMKQMASNLFAFRDEGDRVAQWSKLLNDRELFKQVNATAELPDGKKLTMEGMWVVDDEKLRKLPGAVIKTWLENGLLSLVHAHLLSLGNLQILAEKSIALASKK